MTSYSFCVEYPAVTTIGSPASKLGDSWHHFAFVRDGKGNTKMKIVYLAGPDVFFNNAAKRGEILKELCDKHGFVGKFPLDSELNLDHVPPRSRGAVICENNKKLICECDAVLANISPFRGPSVDPGTAFEIGYADALGKKIVCYTDKYTEYRTRVNADGNQVEDWGLVDNLMIGSQPFIFKSPLEAITALVAIFKLDNDLDYTYNPS
jgi:nucleoside 2-deoxyribosyltransferase